MHSSLFSYASALALLSVAAAQTSYTVNTNANCVTSSDVNYQQVYYYDPNDTMDWGVYTQSQGTCDSGSYARVHLLDPSGNDIDCGYVPLDGQLHLTSCSNYPRGYMLEGQFTLYWETTPGSNQYSWNQFTVSHSQSSVTAATPTQTATTTPITVLTTTITSTPTQTTYIPQITVTSPSATVINTINVTPAVTTITTTSTSYYSLLYYKYVQTTSTAVITAPCYRESITSDKTGKRNSGNGTTSNSTTTTGTTATTTTSTKKATTTTCLYWFCWVWRRDLTSARDLKIRDDVPNTVGMPGGALTTTITPAAVITTVTAATSTSIITSTTNAPGVTVTSSNPTPTLTIYSGQAVSTTTITLPQVTKSIVKNKLALTMVTSTVTLTYTKKTTTTPVCTPSAI